MALQDGVLDLDRRRLLAAAGVGGAVVAALPGAGQAAALTTSAHATDPVATPPVSGLHLQFGSDASAEVAVSWHSLQPVQRPRVLLGRPGGALLRVVEAKAAQYTDAKSGQVVHAWHARIGGLKPDTAYMYAALHDGAEPEFGSFRTAPRGRAHFTFTSFGDQGTPTLGRKGTPATPLAPLHEFYVNDNLGSPAAADVTLGVERLRPLFHLFNGDLCYANLAHDRVRTWWDFWANNSRSARNRPWMPSPGNHENELGNGPIGYQAYQTYFCLPEAEGQTGTTHGLWYAFTVGSVRVISIANDDICYQQGGDSYVRGYSAGAQKAWLEKALAAAGPTRRSTGSWSACTRWPSRPRTNRTAPISAFARSGCRCSTSMKSIWWSAGMSITTSAPIRSAAMSRTRPARRCPSPPKPG